MNNILSDLAIGDTGKVVSINAGRDATKRLYEMGFNTGSCIEVLKNDRGPVIVTISGNKIAIGRGLAEKISLEI